MKRYSNKTIIASLNLPMLTCFDDIVKEVRLDAKLIYWLTKKDAYRKYKTFYIATGINKNIQVIQSNSKIAEYSLAQDAIINDIK